MFFGEESQAQNGSSISAPVLVSAGNSSTVQPPGRGGNIDLVEHFRPVLGTDSPFKQSRSADIVRHVDRSGL